MSKAHVCPPFCHRCPALGGVSDYFVIRAVCTASAVYPSHDFHHCSCATRCAVCNDWAEGRCFWPVDLYIPTCALDLLHGDTVAPYGRKFAGSKIVDIQASDESLNVLEFTLRIPNGDGHGNIFRWAAQSPIPKLTRAECAEPVCFRHLREVDEGKYICAAHWAAQLEVA